MTRRVIAVGVVLAGSAAAAIVVLAADDATPRRAAIVFERGDGLNPAIYLMAADGESQRQLVPYGSQPKWSPGGQRVAFVVHSPPEDEPPPDELWIVDADGRFPRRAVRDAWITSLTWSPDGKRIAWVSAPAWPRRNSISVVDLRTGDRRTLGSGVGRPGSVDWSPDGRELLTVDDGDLVAVDVASGRRRTIRAEVDASDAVWSPTGRRIAYVAPPEPPQSDLPGREQVVVRLERSIFLVHADGSGMRRLTRGALDFSPSWAPAGDTIAFSRWEHTPSSELRFESAIYSVSLRSAKLGRLTDAGRNRKPDWRPPRRLEPELRIAHATLPEPSVRVPDVGSLDVREATRAIEEAGLRPIASSPGQLRPSGEVVLQSPRGGARVPPRTVVQLVSRRESGRG